MTFVLRWLFALVLGAALIYFGILKILAVAPVSMQFMEPAHIFQFIEANAEANDLPLKDYWFPELNILTGVVEILAGLLLILPATRIFGALLGTGVAGGAVAMHLSQFSSFNYLGISAPVGFAASSDKAAPFTVQPEPGEGETAADLEQLAETVCSADAYEAANEAGGEALQQLSQVCYDFAESSTYQPVLFGVACGLFVLALINLFMPRGR